MKTNITQKMYLILFGIIVSLILTEIALRIAGTVFMIKQEQSNKSNNTEKEYRILCIGESMTALGGKNSYPSQLENILKQKIPDKKIKVINKGVPGISTSGILLNLEHNLNKYKPHIVLAMIGINDEHYRIGSMYSYEFDTYKGPLKIFLKLRVVKLFSLIWQHLSNKVQDTVRLLTKYPQELGVFYISRGMYDKAGAMFMQAIKNNPEDINSYIKLGSIYRLLANGKDAISMYEKAISIDPNNIEAVKGLGHLYYELGRYTDAEKILKSALVTNPADGNIPLLLSMIYVRKKEKILAENMLKEALNNKIDFFSLHYNAVELYKLKHDHNKALNIIKNEMAAHPCNSTPYNAIISLYKHIGNEEEENKYKEKRKTLLSNCYNSTTKNNYLHLIRILKKRGIKLAAVQYPTLDTETLKNILGEDSDVIFVDNNKIFIEAVRDNGYNKVFIDNFAGSFGHCSKYGNYILADNISGTILPYLKN